MNNILGTVGLCRKAGKIVFGFDAVAAAVKDPNVKVGGILLAADLSEKSKKEVRFICEKFSVDVTETEITLDEFGSVLGKRTGIIAVTDAGFYGSITKSLK